MVAFSASVFAGIENVDSAGNVADSVARIKESTLSVHSLIEGVRAYVDSQFIGVVPFDSCIIGQGTHILRFIHPQSKRWLNGAITETVFVRPYEHLVRTVTFPDFVLIVSTPFGATVQRDRITLGTTPLYLPSTMAASFISLTKAGFQDATVPAGKSGPIVLQPIVGNASESGQVSQFLSSNQAKSSSSIYLTTAATVVAGTAAAYFKIKADNAYADYRQNGDQESLDRVRHNDTLSSVALVVCEVNLVALAVFLFSRQ